MLNSYYRTLGPVRLPYAGRQLRYHTFDLERIVMPMGFEDYLEPVRRLCNRAGAWKGEAMLTVDERVVRRRESQRRPKPHVDGCLPVIIASNAVGCRVYEGRFDGEPRGDGDLSHLALPEGEVLPADAGFLLSPDCVHESLVQLVDVVRTFLRITLPEAFVDSPTMIEQEVS